MTENYNEKELDCVYTIIESVKQDEEKFIFETLRPYCEAVVSKEVSKKELEKALLMYYGDRLTGNEYQALASRTINYGLCAEEQEYHALHGMVGEIGEIHSLYQKEYQGHAFDEEHAKKEFGDLLWFIAEYCTANGWNLEDIMRMNIDKLKARYPEGFETDKSLNRKEGDI